MTPACYGTKGGVGNGRSSLAELLKHLIGTPGDTGFGSASTADDVASKWDGAGKAAVVTGSSSGIGLETARSLASRGCHVILACRDADKASRVEASIQARHSGARTEVMKLDLASLSSVRAFAAALQRAHPGGIHLLIANAGVVFHPYELTVDGHEMTFQSNHLGHFLLAHHAPYPAHAGGPIRFGRRTDREGFHPFSAYAESKLCNVLHARELQARADAAGERLIVAAVHPGVVATDAIRHLPLSDTLKWLLRVLMRPFIKRSPAGAATTVYVATAPSLPKGEYWLDCNLARGSAASHDAHLGRRLWEESEQLCVAHLQ